jgi:transposase
MSLKPRPILSVPGETADVAHKAFPKGNVFMKMRDELGVMFEDEHFTTLYPEDGQPAERPSHLALVTIMQFVENLTDRQAADAVRDRITWKYALGLELSHAGFDHSVLCEFRQRLISGGQERILFDNLLERFKTKGFVKVGGKQRSDSTHVLAVVRDLNRLELVGETLRAALNRLAQVVPGWIQTVVPVSWYDRYALPFEVGRLPESVNEKQQLAIQIGADGFALLQAIYHADSPTRLRQIPAVCVLQQVWIQQYYAPEQAGVGRDNGDLPPCHIRIESPYDTEARYASKGRTQWVGDKVHITESCDAHLPYLLTDVQTTLATVNDQEITATIHADLGQREILPSQDLIDSGYTSADVLVNSQQRGVAVIGKVTADPSWQRREQTGYDSATFTIDWEAKQAHCPQGSVSQ